MSEPRGGADLRRGPRRIVEWSTLLLLVVGALGCATAERPDPLEKMNRKFFAFNEGLDRHALEPLARGYDFVVPGPVQEGVRNFYHNLEMPIVIANEVLQAKPARVVEDVARLFFNTTLGLGGFFDVATRVGIPDNDEDFGQTLGRWGVPPGPYLVVPVLGPYSLRDGIGEIADTTASSYAYMNFFWFDVVGLSESEVGAVSVGSYAYRMLNLRAIYLEEIEQSRKDAFDYYVFVRNAYLQNREARVRDSTDSAPAIEEDLYEVDDEESYDEESYDEEGHDEESEKESDEGNGDEGGDDEGGDSEGGDEEAGDGGGAEEGDDRGEGDREGE